MEVKKSRFKLDRGFFIRLIIITIIGMGIVCTYNGVNGAWDILASWSNGCFIAGGAIICVSMLVLVSSFGAFEIFSYMVKRRKLESGAHETYSSYCERHDQEGYKNRFIFVPYLIAGFLFLLVSMILLRVK